LGVSAATAVVAPKVLAETRQVFKTPWITFPSSGTYRFTLLPDGVTIHDSHWKFIEHLRQVELKQLGAKDLKALQRIKRNV
jgi:hypothetical protein